jgi:hypothetical protein
MTQGIQNWKNSVPLIEGRTTVVRVHVKTDVGTVAGVNATLSGRGLFAQEDLPGSPLKPVRVPQNEEGKPEIGPKPARGALEDSFMFVLPDAWTKGDPVLQFKGVTHEFECLDWGAPCATAPDFERGPPLRLRITPISYEDAKDKTHAPTQSHLQWAVNRALAALPVAMVFSKQQPVHKTSIEKPGGNSGFLPGSMERLVSRMQMTRLFSKCPDPCPVDLGVLVDPPINGVTGLAGIGVATAYVELNRTSLTVPHELGHVLGREHVNCLGTEAGPDDEYPYENGKISSTHKGDDAFWALDIYSSDSFTTLPDVVLPTGTGDLMSYCGTRWTSDYTWTAVRKALEEKWGTASMFDPPGGRTLRSAAATEAPRPVFAVSGFLSGDSASIDQVQSGISTAVAPLGNSDYEVVLRDTAGKELSASPAELTELESTGMSMFVALLPHDEDAAQIALVKDGEELDVLERSPHPPSIGTPSVEVAGNKATIEWEATDPDGDPLSFDVRYSLDGGASWQSGAVAVEGSSVVLEPLAGSPQAIVEVAANDGFDSVTARSPSFSVPDRAPSLEVMSPAPHQVVLLGRTLVLQAFASDLEDGATSDIRWTSAGVIGTGDLIPYDTGSLRSGANTISASVADSKGQTSERSVRVVAYPGLEKVPRCAGKIATMVGTAKGDRIAGTPGPDVIVGLGGDDVLVGLGGNDVLCGASGRDRVLGSAGNDRLVGGSSVDALTGGPGADECGKGKGDRRRSC